MGAHIDQRIYAWALAMVRGASARALAAARIAVGVGAVGFGPIVWSGVLGTVPEELWRPPRGTESLVGVIPVTDLVVTIAGVALVLGAIAVLLGFWHRVAAGVAASALLYLGWVHQLTGKTDHYHHLLWFLVIVALFPAGDRWSVDAWLRRRRGMPPMSHSAQAYALPLAAIMITVGLIYFFAGVAKIRLAGLEWIFSDNLRNTMHRVWWEKGLDPRPLVDGAVFSRLLAGATVVFEIGFLPMILRSRTRRYARFIGLAFHTGVWITLGISFFSLMLMYVVFFDWPPEWADRQRRGALVTSALPPRFSWAITLALLFGVAVFGLIGIERSWPLAAYPSFAAERTAEPVVLEVLVEGSSGEAIFLRDSQLAERYGAAHAFNMMFSGLAKTNDGDLTPMEAFTELFEEAEGASFGTVVEVEQVIVEVDSGQGHIVSRSVVFPNPGP